MINPIRVIDLRVRDCIERTRDQISFLEEWRWEQYRFFAPLHWMNRHPGKTQEDFREWRDNFTVEVDERLAELVKRLARIDRIRETFKTTE